MPANGDLPNFRTVFTPPHGDLEPITGILVFQGHLFVATSKAVYRKVNREDDQDEWECLTHNPQKFMENLK